MPNSPILEHLSPETAALLYKILSGMEHLEEVICQLEQLEHEKLEWEKRVREKMELEELQS